MIIIREWYLTYQAKLNDVHPPIYPLVITYSFTSCKKKNTPEPEFEPDVTGTVYVNIPFIASWTAKGADGKNYFLSAAKLYNWMNKTLPNSKKLYNSDGGRDGLEFNNKLKPDKGIYIMKPNWPSAPNPLIQRPGFSASGHCSLYDGNTCMSGKCFFQANGGVAQVTLWILN